MATVFFTSNLRRHVDCSALQVEGETVRDALDQAFLQNERLRSYVLDDQGALRKHMRILVDGRAIADFDSQSDAITSTSEVWVMQALSGG